MNSQEAYIILNLTSAASPQDVKAAYRRLAKLHHPDISKEVTAQAKFQKISAAYDLLKDFEPSAQRTANHQWTPPPTSKKPQSPDRGYDYIKANKIYELLDGNVMSKTILLYESHLPANTVLVLMWRDREYRVYFKDKHLLPFTINVNPPGLIIRFKTQE